MRGFVALSNWMRKVWSHHFVKEVLFLTTTKWHSGVSCGQGHDPILHSHASDYKARHLCLSVCLSVCCSHISRTIHPNYFTLCRFVAEDPRKSLESWIWGNLETLFIHFQWTAFCAAVGAWLQHSGFMAEAYVDWAHVSSLSCDFMGKQT